MVSIAPGVAVPATVLCCVLLAIMATLVFVMSRSRHQPSVKKARSGPSPRSQGHRSVRTLPTVDTRGILMNWDVSVLKFSRPYRSVREIPDHETPLALGSRSFVHQQVCRQFPGTSWADPFWGTWEGAAGAVEFNLSHDDPACSMMIHVRATHAVRPSIAKLCAAAEWQGIDCSNGRFVELRPRLQLVPVRRAAPARR